MASTELSRSWTGDQIVAAIQAWAERTGEPPTSNGWRKSRSSAQTTGETPAPGDHPSTRRVVRGVRLLVGGDRGCRVHPPAQGQPARGKAAETQASETGREPRAGRSGQSTPGL